VEPEPVVIDEDTTWSGRHGAVLDRPTVVESGAALTIERCNLSVDLLDLVMGNASWLSVERGASLAVRESRISITYDPRLEDAVFVPYSGSMKGACSLSRAVNLAGTEAPVLELDLLWWAMETTLVVCVQREPGAPLETVASLAPPDDGVRAWRHYEVPLTAFKGSVARVVLFPSDGWGGRDLLVGRLLVTDGGASPTWDELRTGRAWEDLWLMRGFKPFFKEFRGQHTRYSSLISARGTVEITRSVLEAPAGLPRGYTYIAAGKFDATNLRPGVRGAVSYDEAPTAGHIEVRDAALNIEGSSLSNVPITAVDARLDVRGSEMSGDATPLSVACTWGSVDSTDLEVRPFSPIYVEAHPPDPPDLAVLAASFDNSSGPLRLSGCNLSGGGRGLDLNHAWAEVEGCAFDGQSWMAIWAHDSRGLGTWEDVARSNTFVRLGQYAFLQTHTAVLDLTGPGRPGPGSMGYFTGLLYWEGQDDYIDWQVLTRIDVLVGHLLMPETLVDASLGVNRISEVTLDLYNDWGGVEDLRIDTSVTALTVVLEPGLAYGDGRSFYKTAFMRVQEEPGPAPGQVNLTVYVRVPEAFLGSWWVDVKLDGALLRALTMAEALESEYSNYNAMLLATVDVAPGPHAMDIEVHALLDHGDELLTSWSRDHLRASGPGQAGMARGFLEAGGGVLMCDPGMTVEAAGITSLDAGSDTLVVMAFLGAGAALMLGDIALPPTTAAWFAASGPGELDLTNVSAGPTVLRCTGSRLGVSNVSSTTLTMELAGSNATISNLTAERLTTLSAFDCQSLLFEGLVLSSQEGEPYAWALGSNVTLRRASIASNGSSLLGMSVYGNGSLTVEASTFVDCILDVWSYERNNVTLHISDCDFEGEASGLKISWDPAWASGDRAFLEGSLVEGNRFQGGDLVCPPAIVDRYIGDNTMGLGSRYIAWFHGGVAAEGKPAGASYVRGVIDADERASELGEDAMGRFYDEWSGLFVEGSLAAPHFTGNATVHFYFVADPSDRDASWVFDFASVPLPLPGEPVKVREWEDVSTLVLPMVQP